MRLKVDPGIRLPVLSGFYGVSNRFFRQMIVIHVLDKGFIPVSFLDFTGCIWLT
ncbi:MAG: hypothetical protein WD035_06875 [Balneolaceae bacterium]